MNRAVFVKAYFKPVGKYETVKIPTGEKKKGLLGGQKDVVTEEKKWVQTGVSDREIDGERLTTDLQQAIGELNADGYEVVSVVAVSSGNYNCAYREAPGANFGWGYGYGYSYSEGLIVTARRSR